MLWRIWLLAGLVVALLLGGASLWVANTPPRTTHCGPKTYDQWGRVRKVVCDDVTAADHRSDYLRYAAFSAAVLTLAAIPLLRRPSARPSRDASPAP
jgi:hypothetical protein